MGIKKKLGKQRKDKFYHLAKETGYRSRAAFKLIQLNRKFEFLQRARVLIDLCAAPGGWLQVAHKFMPVSSVIIGVDLVPIKPISNVITLQEDITTPKCRQSIKKELKSWKVDVVLHDGAPNVGKNWLHDAFQQARLTLMALKLASEFLVRGGWFVTKVFRSKDYHALLWVFNKLFKKVHATKPQASRSESAEIFVVCQHYLAPDKIDPKFLDPAHVFKEVVQAAKAKLNLNKLEKGAKKKAEGYDEGDYTLYHQVPASEFINSANHMEQLGENNEIVLDTDFIKTHPLTTPEIVECCKDLKVLGRKDLKKLLTWRKKLKELMEQKSQSESSGPKAEEIPEAVDKEEDDEYEKLKKLDEELKMQVVHELKRKKKKVLKEKRKLRDKMNLRMVIKNDVLVEQEDLDLFQLNRCKTREAVEQTAEADVAILDNDVSSGDGGSDDDEAKKWVPYDREKKHYELGVLNEAGNDDGNVSSDETDSSGGDGKPLQFESSADEEAAEEDEDDSNVDQEKNPLLVKLAPEPTDAEKASMWFGKVQVSDESDEDLELEMMADHLEKKKTKNGLHVTFASDMVDKSEDDAKTVTDVKKLEGAQEEEDECFSDNSGDSEDDDYDHKISLTDEQPQKRKKKKIRLDPEGLALGSIMIQSQKKKRDVIEAAYNRYTFNDENLPKWFVDDEKKHYRKNLPITLDMVSEYKERLKEINARPIRKIAEAKTRKKRRAMRRMEKARKRAEALIESEDMSEKEKAEHVRTIYKKALKAVNKRPNVTLVVAKKGLSKKATRPPGVKGKFKIVDPRMKKDHRKQKLMDKKKGKRKGSKGGGQRKK